MPSRRLRASIDLALIADEVFADYPLSGSPPASVLRQQTALTFALGGLSKSVGLPQVKLGWMGIGGPAGLVEEAMDRLETICDAYLSVSTPVQVAAPDLLKSGAAVRAQIQQRVRENFAVAAAACASACPACSVMPVEAGWYAVMQVPAIQVRRDDRARRARPDRRPRASRVFLRFRARGVPRDQPSPRKPACLPLPCRPSCARSAAFDDAAAPGRYQRSAVFPPFDAQLGHRRDRRHPASGRLAARRVSIGASDSSAQRAGAVRIVSVLGPECDGNRSAVHQHLDDGRRRGVRGRVEARARRGPARAENRLQGGAQSEGSRAESLLRPILADRVATRHGQGRCASLVRGGRIVVA